MIYEIIELKKMVEMRFNNRILTKLYTFMTYISNVLIITRELNRSNIDYNSIQDLIYFVKVNNKDGIIKRNGIEIQAYSTDSYSLLSISDTKNKIYLDYSLDNTNKKDSIVEVVFTSDETVRYTHNRYIHNLTDNPSSSSLQKKLELKEKDIFNKATKFLIKTYFLE